MTADLLDILQAILDALEKDPRGLQPWLIGKKRVLELTVRPVQKYGMTSDDYGNGSEMPVVDIDRPAPALTAEDLDLFQQLLAVAVEWRDGHLTIMKFTTNWRVCLYTPANRDDISDMPSGSSFAEAARKALAQAETQRRAR